MNQVFWGDYLWLIYGFIFTFFIPGFLIVELFFTDFPGRIKIPLYFVLSLIVSTYWVYLVSLVLGFSRLSIIIASVFFIPLAFFLFRRKRKRISPMERKTVSYQLFGGGLFYLIFFLALAPGIFTLKGGNFVLAAPNWQDTAMHLGIIESITQGNFPPQAPYFAGFPLNYYFFADFHASILNKLFGHFFPRVLVWDNPLLAAVFFMTLFGLFEEFLRKRKLSFWGALTAALFGNWIFLRFFQELKTFPLNGRFLVNAKNLIASRVYSLEYEGLFQMATMADYFLQNRPMMVGLTVVSLIALLLTWGFKKKDPKAFFLAGFLAGALSQFQFFAAAVAFLILGLALVIFYPKRKTDFLAKSLGLFILSALPFYLPFLAKMFTTQGQSLWMVFKNDFHWGPWEDGKPLSWYFLFLGANFGLIIPLSLVALITGWLGKRKGKRKEKIDSLPLIWGWVLLVIPFICCFTPYKVDMFKFFYFAVIFLTLAVFGVLRKIKKAWFGKVILVLVVSVSIFSSLLTLMGSAWNKSIAYSVAEYQAGLWIRENTPLRSVFVTLPTVHSPVTQIGGRLRVLSYLNWPYSHGFNLGKDNVWTRLKDVEGLYQESSLDYNLAEIMDKYQVDYIYYGSEEREKYPAAGVNFERTSFLVKVYDDGGIAIFRRL